MPQNIEIIEFSAAELDIYARLNENQLLNRANLSKGLFIAESPKVVERAMNAGYEPVSMLVEKKHIEGEAKDVIARCGEIPIYTAEFEVLKQLAAEEKVVAIGEIGLDYYWDATDREDQKYWFKRQLDLAQ